MPFLSPVPTRLPGFPPGFERAEGLDSAEGWAYLRSSPAGRCPGKKRVGLYYSGYGHVGHLPPIGKVYVGNQVPQPQECFDLTDSLFARRFGDKFFGSPSVRQAFPFKILPHFGYGTKRGST